MLFFFVLFTLSSPPPPPPPHTTDLIEGGQSKIAFQELQSIISTARNSKTRQWSEVLEDVALKCVSLAVQLRTSSEAKQTLLFYKSICGNDHPESLDKVLKHYVELSENAAKSTQAQIDTESLKDLDSEVPENILMSEISGVDMKDRKDREIMTPLIRFLWETYRTVLDMVKISPSKELQIRYHVCCLLLVFACLFFVRDICPQNNN